MPYMVQKSFSTDASGTGSRRSSEGLGLLVLSKVFVSSYT